MTHDYPFHIRPEDYSRLVRDSRTEREAWANYISAAGNANTTPPELERRRTEWREMAAHLAENVSYILRMHMLVADVVEAGKPDPRPLPNLAPMPNLKPMTSEEMVRYQGGRLANAWPFGKDTQKP
jgi:hypothetical protein